MQSTMDCYPVNTWEDEKEEKQLMGPLKKDYSLTILKLYRKSMVVISTDAANCYDRMCHSYISFACIKLGLAAQLMIALLKPLQEGKHHIRTAYGDSKGYFQRAGQGNTGAAHSYRSGLHTIREIDKHIDQTAIIVISCDNDRSLELTETHQYVTTKSQHFYVCKAIIYMRNQIRYTLSYEQVD